MTRTTLIASTTSAHVDWNGGSKQIPVTLSYDSTDPFVVTVTIVSCLNSPDGAMHVTTWQVSRELLHELLNHHSPQHHVGEGDVRLSQDVSGVTMDFTAVTPVPRTDPSGGPTLTFQPDSVHGFMRASTDLVPMGGESLHFDWDQLLMSTPYTD